ncbi:PREDICTED: uncharacterized protein LOC109210451 [Nicotiana attenuata]|uniref:uncharacterized protein LOC109210451 n=1 Tax=Nicotiana attenuata TaxID=49451 RepID=UPI0009059CEF|nr:PREDICTED: uncharacterized protein LOC109210451 [Nicotiana attenuata]
MAAKTSAFKILYEEYGAKEGIRSYTSYPKLGRERLGSWIERGASKTKTVRLLNEDGDRNIVLGELENSESRRDFGFGRRIRWEEVDMAIRMMSRGKATRPDEISVEFWKEVGRVGLEWLTNLFNIIFKMKKMTEDWRWSLMISLYKNKGDIQNCNNYRGTKLLSHTMNVWERVVEKRVRTCVSISENQLRFMPGRSTTEAIQLVRGLVEQYRERKKGLAHGVH